MLKSLIQTHLDCFELIILEKGDIISFENQKIPLLYWILQGTLQIGKLNFPNKIITQGVLKNKSCFIIKPNAYSLHQGKAVEITYLLGLNLRSLDKITKLNPIFLRYILNGIYQSSTHMQEFSLIFVPKTVYSRTIALLLYLAKYFGYHSFRGTEIQVSISQANIAQILGSSRVSITRIFKCLQKTQCLEMNRNRIVIKNPVYLSYLVQKNNI